MKVYMKPIKVRSDTETDGSITPLKFKIETPEKEFITVRIKRIQFRGEEKLAGNRMLIFRCETETNVEKIIELKYELNTCKWFLYKM